MKQNASNLKDILIRCFYLKRIRGRGVGGLKGGGGVEAGVVELGGMGGGYNVH